MTDDQEPQEYADLFQDLEVIGRGHFAVVRRCVEISTGREFASKLVRKRRVVGSRRGQTPEDIQREVDILQSVNHPNVVRLHRYFDCGPQQAILVLELVPGGELFQLVSEKGSVGEEEAAGLVRYLLLALKHLHQDLIVHLDLKPENILLHEEEGLKLIDFGLSRWLTPGVEIREINGTPEFVAPEVVNFEPVSTATDMWSVGVITYNLLSGISPFLGEDKQDTFSNVSCGAFCEDSLTGLSQDAKDFIQSLLKKEPRKRATAEHCLQHPWILKFNKVPVPFPENIEAILEETVEFLDSSIVPPAVCQNNIGELILETDQNLDYIFSKVIAKEDVQEPDLTVHQIVPPSMCLDTFEENLVQKVDSVEIPSLDCQETIFKTDGVFETDQNEEKYIVPSNNYMYQDIIDELIQETIQNVDHLFLMSPNCQQNFEEVMEDVFQDVRQRDENFVVAAFFSSLEEGNLPGLEEIFRMSSTLDPDQANKHGETAVHMAAGLGHLDILRYLHSKKADLRRLDGHGDSAIYWAARQGHEEVIRYLHTNGVPLDTHNKAGESALHVTARYGHTPAVQLLCSLGANANAIDEHGETALHIAVWHGFPKIVHVLCQEGALTNVRNKDQETPLHCASARGHSESVRCLLEARADPDLLDKHGCTSLHLALRRHHLAAAMLLLQSGCKVDVVDSHGEAPIHISCREGLLPLVQTLCAYGCTVDIPNKVGLHPLHLAAKNGHRDVARCLCLAGCNVEQKNRDGLTAEIMGLAQGYSSIADILSRVKNDGMRDELIAQLIPTNQPVSRIKLKVFGHSGVGKTTLLDSLQAGYFSSWFRSLGKASSPNSSMAQSNGSLTSRSSNELDLSGVSESGLSFETLNNNYTRGIDVRQVNISGVGDLSIWEFSGHEPYHLMYEHFVGNTSCLHAVLFRLSDPLDVQIQQVHYWLHFLQARIPPIEPLGPSGKSRCPARVCLVATHADLASAHNNNINSKEDYTQDPLIALKAAQLVLNSAQERFQHIFDLHNTVFVMDAHLASSAPVKALKQYLSAGRIKVLKGLPYHTTFLEGVLGALSQWRRLSSTFPVQAWPQFVEQVQNQVNILAGQEHLREALQQLQLMGEVLYLKAPAPVVPMGSAGESSGQDLVVLNPRWLTCDVVGYLLSKEHIQQARLTGCYTVDDMQLLFPDTDALDLLQVLECLHLCTQCQSDGEIEYEFPCFNLVETSLDGLWEKNDVRFLQGTYAGVRLQCPPGVHHMLACLFPRLQVQLRRCAQEQSPDPEAGPNDLYQWYQGSKFCSGPVEALLTLRDAGEAIEVKVRAPPDMQSECFCLLEDLLGVAEQTLSDSCPGLLVEKHLLSAWQLRRHLDYVTGYSHERIFKALLGSSSTSPSKETIPEEEDFDSSREEAGLTTVPDLHVSHLSLLSRQHLCALLDPNDSMGQDWCMLGVLLGMMDKLPKVDPEHQLEQMSPTARLLEEWSKCPDSTVGRLLRALGELGRHDASQVIFRTAPLLKVLPLDRHGLFVEEEEEESSSQDTGIHVGSHNSNLSR